MGELQSKKIISLMSGTSCDSIDVGYCEVRPDLTCELINGINVKYPKEIKQKLFQLFNNPLSSLENICSLNVEIGNCFADAANKLIKKHNKPDFIASHGQTIYHSPETKSTLQIGESSVIASKTNCLTISNFRESDMATGGQGAPVVCFADEKWGKKILLERELDGLIFQNIGGISNATVVSNFAETIGFDTGPGNVFIDYVTQKYFDKPYDKNGDIAAKGKVSKNLLNCLLEDEFYFKSPPKSTGREYFSIQYIENILKSAKQMGIYKPEDILATVTALTAKSIALSYKRYITDTIQINETLICGGGAYNKTLMNFLREYIPTNIKLKTCEDYGISNNFKEVMAFAVLGYCTYYQIPNNLPSCTGAKKRIVLGKITNI